MRGPVVRDKVVVCCEPGAEKQSVRAAGHGPAMVPRALKLPGGRFSSQRMGAHFLFAGVQVEGPGFGVDCVPDD